MHFCFAAVESQSLSQYIATYIKLISTIVECKTLWNELQKFAYLNCGNFQSNIRQQCSFKLLTKGSLTLIFACSTFATGSHVNACSNARIKNSIPAGCDVLQYASKSYAFWSQCNTSKNILN